MNIERCTNKDCRRPFDVNEFGGQMPGTKEMEDITCPYCSHTIQRISNGVFRTHALTPEQEARYNAANP
jgi:DNA-directed RNA polymerase subunit RPC12/RpoP